MSNAVVGEGAKGAAGLGVKDSESIAAQLGKHKAVHESFVAVNSQTAVRGSDGKLTLASADLIATTTRLGEETSKAVAIAMGDKAIYPEGRVENAGKLYLAEVEKCDELLEKRVPMLAAQAHPPQPPQLDVPTWQQQRYLEQFLSADPVIRAAVYKAAPPPFARALEGLGPQLKIGKDGASFRFEPLIADELREERWAADATPIERERYEGAKQIHAAARGYLKQLRQTALDLARECGVVGRSIKQ